MRGIILLLMAVVTMQGAAQGQLQSVEPQDSMFNPRIVGGMNIGGGTVSAFAQVTVTGTGPGPLNRLNPGDVVEVWLAPGVPTLCYCSGRVFRGVAAGAPGTASVTIDVMYGGCATATPSVAWIDRLPGGVPPAIRLRTYTDAVSADWDGVMCNTMVTLADFAFFGGCFMIGGCNCADYSGDGVTSLVDFIFFAQNWGFLCP